MLSLWHAYFDFELCILIEDYIFDMYCRSLHMYAYIQIMYMYHEKVQSDLGYMATLGPAPIRISNLAGYGSYA